MTAAVVSLAVFCVTALPGLAYLVGHRHGTVHGYERGVIAENARWTRHDADRAMARRLAEMMRDGGRGIEDVAATTELCPGCLPCDAETCDWPSDLAGLAHDHHGPGGCPLCHDTGECPPIPATGRQRFFDWNPA